MTVAAQIVIDRVNHLYRPPRGREVLALDQVSLEVANREFVALLGPSGCGKSTLLYLIGGFLPVETGAILIDGQKVAGPGPDRGIVFQHLRCFRGKPCVATFCMGLNDRACPRTNAKNAQWISSTLSDLRGSRTAIRHNSRAA